MKLNLSDREKMKIFQWLIPLCTFMAGCAPGAYFSSSNDVSKMEGTIFLRNGTAKTGLLSIDLESVNKQDPYYEPDRFILLVLANVKEKIPLDSVDHYKIGDDVFFPKVIDYNFDEARNGYKRLLFLKRLSGEGSKIGLYELLRKNIADQNGYHDERLYYLTFPNYTRLQTLSTNSAMLVPNFETKMGSFVGDCPTLAEKIRTKQKGYFVPYFAIDIADKVEVLKRIVNEYNQCK